MFKDDVELFKDVILFLHKKNSTALGIKTKRYLNEIPEEIIDLCNELDFPLIHIPYEVAWIDIINAVNSIAMNRYIIRINDRKNADRLPLRSDNFRKKIETIVMNLSEEINYPISIVDILEDEVLNYPNRDFVSKDDISYIKGDDFPFNYQKEIVGDRLNICRITNINKIYPLLKESDSEELISTLKVYLESESNSNIAAKKLFIHSNTVRYRIAKTQQICDIDLEDPMERLKIEILLKFIELFNDKTMG